MLINRLPRLQELALTNANEQKLVLKKKQKKSGLSYDHGNFADLQISPDFQPMLPAWNSLVWDSSPDITYW